MKTMRNLLWAGMIFCFNCSPGNAQIIYSNNFALSGATNIQGMTPTVAGNFAGGIASATWNDVLGANDTGSLFANGIDNTTLGNSWLLPFYPQAGYVYTLTASLTFTGNPGSWVGLGFAQNNSADVPAGNGRFADSSSGGPVGYDWMILTESSGNVQYFSGPKANTPQIYSGTGFTGGRQTLIAQIILNTTGSVWSITAYVNGVQLGNTTNYATYPPIGGVGLTQNTLTAPATVQWNYLTLQAAGGGPPTNTINASVSFPSANPGLPLNPAFSGLSYEKLQMTKGFFTSNNLALIHLFNLLGPGVIRIGAGTADQTCWNGLGGLTNITASEVDQFAGFIKAVPNWSVIYGLNFSVNTSNNCAAEASYASGALGSRLIGFEIGNEPEAYANNGIRSAGYTYADFLQEWKPLELAARHYGTVVGPASGGTPVWTTNFAHDESGIISMATQHYYRLAATDTNATLPTLLASDPAFVANISSVVPMVTAANLRFGLRMDEVGSFSGGGKAGVSDAYGAALWSLDFMFTVALNGGQGVNFHGGGLSPYSPLINNGTNVTTVGPEYYGLKMFSLLPPGNVVPATLTLASNINFTAYGVRQTNGAISVVLNNKDANDTVAVSFNPGPDVAGAQLIELTGPSLYSTSGYTIGGATINPDGTWNGGVQAMLTTTNGQWTVNVPPASAILLNPILAPPEMTFSVNGSHLSLNWPTNYTGWRLQSNSIGLAATNWFSVSGSANTNQFQITIQPGQSNVFYRLSQP